MNEQTDTTGLVNRLALCKHIGGAYMPKKTKLCELESLFLLVDLRSSARKAFEPMGFSLYEVLVLLHVEQSVEQPKELARLLDVHTSALSTLLSALVDRGLVVRLLDERDKRFVNFRLTVAGCVAVSRIREAWLAQQAISEP